MSYIPVFIEYNLPDPVTVDLPANATTPFEFHPSQGTLLSWGYMGKEPGIELESAGIYIGPNGGGFYASVVNTNSTDSSIQFVFSSII